MTYPNPWDFQNESKELISPDQENKIEYSDLGEIAMGAPLGGYCEWVDKNGIKTKLDEWFGGPAIWNTEGTKVAIPTWTRKFLKGTVQRLSILDINEREIIKYKKTFDVLDLRRFDKNEIYGYDSPIHKTKTVKFDLTNERIIERKKI
ncbi:MAG: hypothetical protein CMB99_02165 [Flavobacteriaceae bacterium]|nr:hypothetical protein [Flavobacteriaceae bacterium]|tara:strand:+ start:69 stop:512 length:444 start_codon:yes stop_codon:yes gene_type:complete